MYDPALSNLPARGPIPAPPDQNVAGLIAELMAIGDREYVLNVERARLVARRDAILPSLPPEYSVRVLANICRVSWARVAQVRRKAAAG